MSDLLDYEWKKFATPGPSSLLSGRSAAETARAETDGGAENHKAGYEAGYAEGIAAVQSERANERKALENVLRELESYRQQCLTQSISDAVCMLETLVSAYFETSLTRDTQFFSFIERKILEELPEDTGALTILMSPADFSRLAAQAREALQSQVKAEATLSSGVIQVKNGSLVMELDLIANLRGIVQAAFERLDTAL